MTPTDIQPTPADLRRNLQVYLFSQETCPCITCAFARRAFAAEAEVVRLREQIATTSKRAEVVK